YTGHLAFDNRLRDRVLTGEERDKSHRDFIQTRLPGAEVTDIRYEHLNDQDGDYTVASHVKVAGYAAKTSARLLLAPALFQQTAPPMVTAADRTHVVSFSYPWTEEDRITIELPQGFRAEAFPKPEDLAVKGIAGHRTSIQQADDMTIRYS